MQRRYGDFDELSAEELAKLDNELQQIKLALIERFPTLDLSLVLPIGKRVVKQYGKDVADTSSLRAIFATNLGCVWRDQRCHAAGPLHRALRELVCCSSRRYAGCYTPMVEVEGGVKPAVNSRLFWEDIPYGLCILKDLALKLGFPTPSIDFMIRWHQQVRQYCTRVCVAPPPASLTWVWARGTGRVARPSSWARRTCSTMARSTRRCLARLARPAGTA